MSNETSAITWSQIPAVEFERALRFYSTVLQKGLRDETRDVDRISSRMGIFPHETGGVGGAVTEAPYVKPSVDGNSLFLLVEGALDDTLGRVQTAGGTVLVPKTLLGPGRGDYGVILDSEGNRIGLHSRG